MFDWIADPHAWIALATLAGLEIVLGVDNIIFISILVGRLPEAKRNFARRAGLLLAMGTRILLLLSLAWVMRLTAPLFHLAGHDIAGRDLILIIGGLFLLWKSVHEIHGALQGEDDAGKEHSASSAGRAAMGTVLIQIAVIDIVFSLDSVITAVGMASEIGVMICAIIASVGVMMFAAAPIGRFVDDNPTIKMLALSFLVLVGVTLIAEGFGNHIPKGYIYFAMAFSLVVEMINIRLRKHSAPEPVKLHKDLP